MEYEMQQTVIHRIADQHKVVRILLSVVFASILVGLAYTEREFSMDAVDMMQVTGSAKNAQNALGTIFAIAGLSFVFFHGFLDDTRGGIRTAVLVMTVALGLYHSKTVYQSQMAGYTLQLNVQNALNIEISDLNKSIADHEAKVEDKKKEVKGHSSFDTAIAAREKSAKEKQDAAKHQTTSVFRDSRADGTRLLDDASKELEIADKTRLQKEALKSKADAEASAEQAVVDSLRTKKSELLSKVKPTADGIFGYWLFQATAIFISIMLVGCEWVCATLLGAIVAAFGHAQKSAAQRQVMQPVMQPAAPKKPIPQPSEKEKDSKGGGMSGISQGLGVAATAGIIGASGMAMATQQEVVLPALTAQANSTKVGVTWREGVREGVKSGFFGKKEGVFAQSEGVFSGLGRGFSVFGEVPRPTPSPTPSRREAPEEVPEEGGLNGIRSEFAELVADIRAGKVATNVADIRARMRCGDTKGAYWRDRLIAENVIRFVGKGKAYEVVV